MKVCELIEELQKHNADLKVVMDSYEDGYELIGEISIIKVEEYKKNDRRWFYGIYKDSDDGDRVLYLEPKDHPEDWGGE